MEIDGNVIIGMFGIFGITTITGFIKLIQVLTELKTCTQQNTKALEIITHRFNNHVEVNKN